MWLMDAVDKVGRLINQLDGAVLSWDLLQAPKKKIRRLYSFNLNHKEREYTLLGMQRPSDDVVR